MYKNLFEHIIFDLDSTLVTIEGIDELARAKNVDDRVKNMTRHAMDGRVAFEDVFFRRLAIIRPEYTDLVDLGKLYCNHVTNGAKELIRTLQTNGINIFVISGSYNPAVRAVTAALGIPDKNVSANELIFDTHGIYMGVDTTQPLWKNTGKQEIVCALRKKYPGRFVMVGDGMTDLAAGTQADAFICFAGIAYRPTVAAGTHLVVRKPNLTEILPYILESNASPVQFIRNQTG